MSLIGEMEQKSGVTFEDAQVALARQWLGPDDESLEYTVKIKTVKPENIKATSTNMGKNDPTSTKDMIKEIKVPATVDKAVEIIKKFEGAADRDDNRVADTVSQHVQKDKTSIEDEQWLGSDVEEKAW